MTNPSAEGSVEEQIEQWRTYRRSQRRNRDEDTLALEHQLRDDVSRLTRAGLAADEAFLVALKRMGSVDAPSREYGREHSSRVWKQLATVASRAGRRSVWVHTDAAAVCFAVLAAVAIKVPALFGKPMEDQHEGFYFRNASLFVLPCLIGYLATKRRLSVNTIGWLAGAFGLAAVFANLPGFGRERGFEELTALHLPIALWLGVGIVHAGGRWSEVSRRMDFIRFSGELFIYYVLIALGGGVLCAFMALTFKSIGIDIEPIFGSWIMPCGAAGAVVIASWLVESKQSVAENIAPVLTRLFTPLFAAMLVAFLATLLWSGRGISIDREVLIGFDLLLVVVLGLLLYSISARDPRSPPGASDVVQVVLLLSVLLADLVALWAIGARISEFGLSPNRVAALGENLILLVNLAWSAVLYIRFLIGRGPFLRLEQWQTAYLPAYAVWAAVVVILFPLAFK